MEFDLLYSEQAQEQMEEFEEEHDHKAILKALHKDLEYMQTDLRHPSLHTHKYDALEGPNGEEVFESYAQNHTPGAYRIFWYYGPGKEEISILDICHHP